MTTRYVSPLFEQVETGGLATYRQYIYAGNRAVAMETRSSVGTAIHYLLRDHLGSVVGVTGASSTEFNSYDAFGKRRNADWSADPGDSQLDASHLTRRGYTGHEQLDAMRLINMQGRIQDPITGRFLSADPFVQAPYASQSLNRYSYAWNNPLSLTDPLGFAAGGMPDGIHVETFRYTQSTGQPLSYADQMMAFIMWMQAASAYHAPVLNRKRSLSGVIDG